MLKLLSRILRDKIKKVEVVEGDHGPHFIAKGQTNVVQMPNKASRQMSKVSRGRFAMDVRKTRPEN